MASSPSRTFLEIWQYGAPLCRSEDCFGATPKRAHETPALLDILARYSFGG
jgi:hypothetical protein